MSHFPSRSVFRSASCSVALSVLSPGDLFSVIDHNSDGMLDLEEVKASVPEGFEGQFMQHVDGNEV